MYATIKRSINGSRKGKISFVKDSLNDLWHLWLLVLDNYEAKALYSNIIELLLGRGYGGIVLITRSEVDNGLGKIVTI
jgi:hypothetical protein